MKKSKTPFEGVVEVPVETHCRASAALEEEVEKELEIEDPEVDIAKAILREEEKEIS